MNTLRYVRYTSGLICGLVISACATTPPPRDLVSARAVYLRASTGPSQVFNPADLLSAKQQLDRAEASFLENGDTQGTRDDAYVAVRKAEFAESVGRTRQLERTEVGVVEAMHDDQTQAVADTAAELDRTKAQLAARDSALQTETSRRLAAEARAAQAATDLAKFATVKQEARGMVITLSGGVLFESAQATLMPSAQLKLDAVGKALIEQDPTSKLMVEGHTDSQGAQAYNQELSQRRAQGVRDYLVSRGIAADRIKAEGFGFARSVASNDSAEGRANNRRVEIVVSPSGP